MIKFLLLFCGKVVRFNEIGLSGIVDRNYNILMFYYKLFYMYIMNI